MQLRTMERSFLIGAFVFTPSVKRLGGPASEHLFAPNALGQSQASVGALPHALYLARNGSISQIVFWVLVRKDWNSRLKLSAT